MYKQIEKRMEAVDDLDGQEFRRLVQNYKDMCDIHDDGKQQTAVEDLTPLAEKLRVWEDGENQNKDGENQNIFQATSM